MLILSIPNSACLGPNQPPSRWKLKYEDFTTMSNPQIRADLLVDMLKLVLLEARPF